MSAAPGAARSSRRALLEASTATVAAAALALSGCGKASRPKVHRLPPAIRAIDVEILGRALELEQRTVAAYTAGIPLLAGSVLDAAKHFLDQELVHVGELSGLIKQVGGKTKKPSPSYPLGKPRGPIDVIRLLHALERAQLATYLQAIPRLSPGPLRAAAAGILANDAQHIAVLRPALGLERAPAAFVSGQE